MSRAKGTPKTGGRVLGTPNKITSTLKEFITNLIAANMGQMERDLKRLQPYQRLTLIERFMAYALPKQQAINAEAALEGEYRLLERLLDTCPDEAIERITEKIVELQKENQDG